MEKNIKDTVKVVFGKNAEKYYESKSHANGIDLPLIIDWLQPEAGWIALDIATGGGHVAKTVAPYVKKMCATDLTEKMLENTAKNLNKQFDNIWYTVADAESLPFLANTFDLVTCRIASHHFPHPEKFINNVSRVLKPGGRFVLIDNVVPEDPKKAEFMNTFEKLRDESHVRCLSIEEWRRLFVDAALIEKRSTSRKKKHDFPIWVVRTASSEDQPKQVSEYILKANKVNKDYFKVVIENEEIKSVAIDEWMVLVEKGE
ncbi:class I SAM-dependent methyltransferase [Alkalihalobacillus sp. BA299]|uniref:class I SAM-dependent methyltransferase n=1 Tax=Alkalihalobacillus sp. BA299 TaxID=2815938 RepID=UPI001ADB4D04|nr:class I SAM-dependent methyltransferase [Alkalihalobacillus sp. BA299]